MSRSFGNRVFCAGVVGVGLLSAGAAMGEPSCPAGCDGPPVFYPNKVRVEWRPPIYNAVPGEIIELGLYIVPETPEAEEEISALQTILNWTPSKLSILSHVDNPPGAQWYHWFFSGFSDDSLLDDLNAGVTIPPLGVPSNDGDAYFEALAQFPPPLGKGSAVATPDGLLVTTFRFQAVGETLSTEVTIPNSMADFTCTFVSWGVTPCDLKDGVEAARVRITQQAYLPGDGDGDGDVDISDYDMLLECAADGGVSGACWRFDFDLDLDVDFHDFAGFQIAFGG